jgi:hypothetical protein
MNPTRAQATPTNALELVAERACPLGAPTLLRPRPGGLLGRDRIPSRHRHPVRAGVGRRPSASGRDRLALARPASAVGHIRAGWIIHST